MKHFEGANSQVMKMSEDRLQYCNIFLIYCYCLLCSFSRILLSFFLLCYFVGKRTCPKLHESATRSHLRLLDFPFQLAFCLPLENKARTLSNMEKYGKAIMMSWWVMMQLNLWRTSVWLFCPVGSANYYSTDSIMEHVSLLFISTIR